MHIPDGYLSPATCVATYGLALPFWYVAFSKLQRRLHTRTVPLVAVFAAFSFVIMMFNLPLPGGTSGHAVGMGVAAIVLGPWASMVAISVALLIQAVFFGDGGLTSLGANCLNMAIVGSLIAYGIYRLVAGQSPVHSARRVFAAGLAGYLAINASALLAALEFGIQPLLFHDAAGTPLYAPYPLHIAIPAMMIGHLSFAGLAEMLLSAGLVAYLQRANPDLLGASLAPPAALRQAWWATRRAWVMLACLMIASPLGLLATGTAWGEWGVEDFTSPQTRQAIMQASHHAPLPTDTPQGLRHLADFWKAPIPDYAPTFIHHPALGYIVSAITGTGLILLLALLLSPWLKRRRPGQEA